MPKNGKFNHLSNKRLSCVILTLLLTLTVACDLQRQAPSQTSPRSAISCRMERIPSYNGGASWIAIHEASHAVAALALGGTVRGFYFTNFGGECDCTHPDSDRMAAIYAAGKIGEITSNGRDTGGGWADYGYIRNLGESADTAEQRIAPILQLNQSAVVEMARLMDHQGRVSGEQAAAIYRKYQDAQSSRLIQSPTNPAGPSQGTYEPLHSWDGTPEGCQRLGGAYDAQQQSCHYAQYGRR